MADAGIEGVKQEATPIPEFIAEDFGDLLQAMNTMAEATKTFSTAMVKFSQDLEKLAKVVVEIKTNQRLKVREGR